MWRFFVQRTYGIDACVMHLICHKSLQKTRILLQCNMSDKNCEDKRTIGGKIFDLNSLHKTIFILHVRDQI